MNYISRQFESRSASKRASIAEAESALNRPLLTDHVSAIAKYLIENSTKMYIMPGLSVNIHTTKPLRFYTTSSKEVIRFGYLFLPQSAGFAITDGQHRVAAVRETLDTIPLELRERFGEDGVPVMISLESEVRQAHQDFADCSRVRPLPPALLATYDRRNAGNRLFLDLVDRCPIFRNKIESTTKSIAKTSCNLFTANQVRSYVKALLLHSWSGSVDQYEEDIRSLLPTPESQEEKLKQILEFTEVLTEAIPIWKTLASLPEGQKARIIEIRAEKYVCLEGEGLVILGYLGFELLTYAPDWRDRVKKLGDINWQESDPIWTLTIRKEEEIIDPKTNAVKMKYGKLSGHSNVVKAIANVRQAIGWEKPNPVGGLITDDDLPAEDENPNTSVTAEVVQ